jgi:cyanophycinase-like exopeptidase
MRIRNELYFFKLPAGPFIMKNNYFCIPAAPSFSFRIPVRLGMGLIAAACFTTSASAAKTTPLPYTYYVSGVVKDIPALTPKTISPIVLMGGGPDVDSAFRWMIDQAGITPATGGRFVVIRATGTEAYNPYILYSKDSKDKKYNGPLPQQGWVGGELKGLTSVETLVIPSREAADHPDVAAIVSRANAVFIAGGDQADYIRYWKGSKLDAILASLMTNNVPVGGTSAGLAVLGNFDFAAINGTVTSAQALSDPYNPYMTLDPDPLSSTSQFLAPPALKNTILDSHLDTRDRMGRLIGFSNRLIAPASGGAGCPGGVLKAAAAKGIGFGVETALLVEKDAKTGNFIGTHATNPPEVRTTEGAIYFVRPSVAPSICASGQPLAAYTIEIRKLLNAGTQFNLSNWSGSTADKTVDVVNGALTSDPY